MDIETVEEVRHGALFNKVLKTDPSALTELGYVLVCVRSMTVRGAVHTSCSLCLY